MEMLSYYNCFNTKISEVENKRSNTSSLVTKQADLANKTDFDNKLIAFNRKIISNKAKDLEIKRN